MSDLIQRLQHVQDNIRLLMKEREQLHERQVEQEAALHGRHQEIQVLKARVAGLEQENEVLRMARSLDGGDGTMEAKQRIDELVNEIDRCLGLINA